MALFGLVASPDRRYERAIVVTIMILIGVRLLCAALTPLAFEECIYWIWSQHIAGGYYDQPPVTPVLIRLGTTLFGNTAFGVRVFGVLLALPASWAVWRASAILFGDERLGATAALYFNLTLVMAVGSIIATPDGPLVTATALLLFALAKLSETADGKWWLAIGVAFGVGMLSKFTMLFFAVSILAWLLLVPQLRQWLLTPWPWLGALAALAVFSPTLIWNAQHDWISVHRQFNRMLVDEWSLRYVGEFLLAQLGLATPPIFVLGCMGLVRLIRGEGGRPAARVLVNAMFWPIVLYFVWHSFRGRVEGNWAEPIFVAFAVAAAVAVERVQWHGVWAAVASWSQRLAVPVGLAIAAVLYAQAIFAVVPLGPADPTARVLGAGWSDVAAKIDDERRRLGAPIVLTKNHALTGWLSFYLPSHPPVAQLNGRVRYLNGPEPEPALFRGAMMYVCADDCSQEIADLRPRFATVEPVTSLVRTRRGVPIETYSIFRLSGPIGAPLDPP
jgi:4-amino-4-deoxy-L-arabinose transferase-like glycosyltransferase